MSKSKREKVKEQYKKVQEIEYLEKKAKRIKEALDNDEKRPRTIKVWISGKKDVKIMQRRYVNQELINELSEAVYKVLEKRVRKLEKEFEIEDNYKI